SGSQHNERLSSGAVQKEPRRVGAFKNIEGVVKKTKNIRHRAHLFDTAVLPALTAEGNPEFRAPSPNEDQGCR
ncbi:hypothetical protein V3C99_004775, partial [Haemonchus contortus]